MWGKRGIRRFISKLMIGSLIAASALTGMFGHVLAAPAASQIQQSADFMQGLGIIHGYEDGSYQFDENMTRAQLVTILVRAFGQQSTAALLKGAPAFPDSGTHWASGDIAIAKNKGWTVGYPDGKFHPDEKVTYGELIQMLDNALGLQTNQNLGWPERAIKAAQDAGFIPSDANLSAYANSYAPRGAAFFYANNAFFNVPLAASGKTIYQTYVRNSVPSIDASASATSTTNSEVTISGKASGATSVTVNGKSVTLNADGSFTSIVTLSIGSNTFNVVATDIVMNTATKTLTVTRNQVHHDPPAAHPASMKVTPSDSIETSEPSLTVTFAVYDQYNRPYIGAILDLNTTGFDMGVLDNVTSLTTDSNGIASIPIPNNAPGPSGTITARVTGTSISGATGTITFAQ